MDRRTAITRLFPIPSPSLACLQWQLQSTHYLEPRVNNQFNSLCVPVHVPICVRACVHVCVLFFLPSSTFRLMLFVRTTSTAKKLRRYCLRANAVSLSSVVTGKILP